MTTGGTPTETDPAPASGRLGRRLPALTAPAYRRFIAAAFVGNVGLWMQATAQGWLVLDLTGSPAMLGLVGALSALPTLLLSLPAGVLADRIDRRRLLVGTQLAVATFALVLAVLTTTGIVAFWQVLLLAVLAGSAQAIATPAFQAIVPSLVDRRVIGNAVALNAAQYNLSRVIGPVAAGVAIAAGGLAIAFWTNAGALALVALVLATLRLPSRSSLVQAEASMWSNLLDGLRYVRGRRTVAALLLLAGMPAILVLNYLMLLPVYARDILDAGPTGLGMMTAAVGIGALTGALTVAVMRPAGGSGRLMLAGLASMSAFTIAFGVSTQLPLSLAFLAGLGASQTTYYSTANTLIQVLVPSRLRGRVMSLYILLAIGLMPLGNLLAGLVAERWSAPVALVGGGVLALVVTGLTAWLAPGLRSLRSEEVVGRVAGGGGAAAVGTPAAASAAGAGGGSMADRQEAEIGGPATGG